MQNKCTASEHNHNRIMFTAKVIRLAVYLLDGIVLIIFAPIEKNAIMDTDKG